MTAKTSLLVAGDLHLGRHPTRIPAEFDSPDLSPRSVWRATVDEAAAREVDAVVLTGDILDQENQFFESYGPLEAGANELVEAGISLLLVAGNHDVAVLHRLFEELDLGGVHVLGQGGNWERWTLDKHDGPDIHFDGWSFPSAHIGTSPLDGYDLPEDPDTVTVGVMHGDLDASSSTYAPISTDELIETPHAAWFLGHIHKPDIRQSSDPFILYPGSPQPLSPVEPGSHGPWLVKIQSDGTVESKQLPLATLRYDHLELDVSAADDIQALPSLITDNIREHVGENVDSTHLQLYLPRLKLVGRSAAHTELEREGNALIEQLEFPVDGVPVHVESLNVQTHPPIELEDLARGEDTPTAWLANLLLSLEDDGPSDDEGSEQLIESALARLREAYGARAYRELRTQGRLQNPDREEAEEVLRRQAWLLLDTLLGQKEQ